MKEMGEVFFSLLTLNNLLYMNIGLLGGIVVGALPGLTATMAVALLVPMTYGLDATTGILMLLGVYCGGTYGGSITAILINTPGTPAAAATAWDGHVLAKKGRAGEALEMALVASVFGGLFSTLVLMFVAPQIAKLALKLPGRNILLWQYLDLQHCQCKQVTGKRTDNGNSGNSRNMYRC